VPKWLWINNLGLSILGKLVQKGRNIDLCVGAIAPHIRSPIGLYASHAGPFLSVSANPSSNAFSTERLLNAHDYTLEFA
jgi:hypothetical protein